MTNFYTLHFNGQVGRFTDETACCAALSTTKGIAFTNKADFDVAMASSRGEFQVMIFNSMLLQAQNAGLDAGLAKPVKKFENRQIALTRIFSLAAALGDQYKDPAAEAPEAPLGGFPSISVNGGPAISPLPDDAPGIHLVPQAQDRLAKAVEGAEAAALANPSPSAVARASELPDHTVPTEEVAQHYGDVTVDNCSADIIYCPACMGITGLVVNSENTQVISCNDCGWKLGDPIGPPEATPIQPTIEVNDMAKKTKKSAAPKATKRAAKTAKAPAPPKVKKAAAAAAAAAPAKAAAPADKIQAALARDTKLAQVVGMLKAKGGTTIAAVMAETGWQKHTCRGFFAGTCKKKLGLVVISEKPANGGDRIYRVA